MKRAMIFLVCALVLVLACWGLARFWFWVAASPETGMMAAGLPETHPPDWLTPVPLPPVHTVVQRADYPHNPIYPTQTPERLDNGGATRTEPLP